WMTDDWPLYESRLKGKLHVISKRYTQRIERHNRGPLGKRKLSYAKRIFCTDGYRLNVTCES
ncbi:IS1 family transposase, partial [Escherichia coli]|nr:IS1 family transposase [Escherichia coli]